MENKDLVLGKPKFASKLWKYIKKTWYFRILELALAFASVFASPLISYALPSNDVPSIINLLSENETKYGQSPIGVVQLTQPDTFYYRYDDFPMASIIRLYNANPAVPAFKIYRDNDFAIVDEETDLELSASLVGTTVEKSDDLNSNLFFPIDGNGGNSWCLASNWDFYPNGLEIGVPSDFADALLDKLAMPEGDYECLLGRELRLSGVRNDSNRLYSISCVFDSSNQTFSNLSGFLGNFCLIRLETPIYMPAELYFECCDDLNGTMTDFLNSLDRFFPNDTTMQEHKLSFYYLTDSGYVTDKSDELFLSSMYALQEPMNMVPMILLGALVAFALFFGFLLAFWIEVRGASFDEKVAACKISIVSLVIGFILSCVAWLIFGGFEMASGYVVPIYTTTNLIVVCLTLLVYSSLAYATYRLSTKRSSNI